MPECIIRRHLKFILLVAVLMLPFTGVMAAEELPVSFAGVCTGDRVNIRSGAGISFDILTQLDKGDKIIVLGKTYGWYKIKIPEGTDCFVHKDYIDVKDSRGVVKGEHVNVRSGAGVKYNILGQLDMDDKIRVKALEGDWYRITAPEDLFAWLHGRYVKYYSTLAVLAAEQQEARLRLDIFQALERDCKRQSAGPVLGADFSGLIKRYQDFLNKYTGSPETDIIIKRLESLNLKAAEKEYKKRSHNLAAKLKEVENEKNKGKLPPPTAVGKIDDLGMIINRPGTHKLLHEGRVIFYLHTKKCNLNQYIYRRVRVWGKVVNLPEWDIPVIEVEMIRPL